MLNKLREEAKEIFLEGVKAVDPYMAVKNALKELNIDYKNYESIYVIGAGKGTAPMARAIEEELRDKIKKGIIVVKYGFSEKLKYIEVIEAGHPIPDENGLLGTEKIIKLLRDAKENDLIISLISGGGSSLLPYPAGNIRLEEKKVLTQLLLECGASIDEINIVRKHISLSKGGHLAKFAFPATVINFMLSDVIGDRADIIASGPFVPDPSTFKDAWEVLEKYDLIEKTPKSILNYLKDGMAGKVPETPKPGDRIFEKVKNRIVASNIIALKACEKKAKELGYKTIILSSMIEGETRDIAKMHCAIAKEIFKTENPISLPACIISGGETTVTIRGNGIGGRNQEFCLQSAIEIADIPYSLVILSGGTDGNDGPTDAAGGIVDPMTVKRGKEKGLDARKFLENNDSYNFLKETDSLFITGPTKTNVMDIHIMLCRREKYGKE